MKKIYIYNTKTLEVIGEPAITSYEDFKTNPCVFYPDWDLNSNLASETKFTNPILIDNEIREKTREELVLLDNNLDLLVQGEFIENEKILKKEVPERILKAKWNSNNNNWEESATKEDIENEINKLINEFIILSEKQEKLKKYGFPTLDIEKELANNILKRTLVLNIEPLK